MTATASQLDRTFAALADPTRRAVVELLRERPQRAGALAEAVSLSAPAMSRHLKVLRDSGLIENDAEAPDARVRIFRLRQEPFTRLHAWLEDVEQLWTMELTAFARHVERTRGPRAPAPKARPRKVRR